MAEKTPTLPPEGHAEVYQPVSMLALAGLLVAAGFAVVLTVLALLAFFKGTPLFLGIEVLVIPALAAGLAYAARQKIRGSEGVLTGQPLTTWALWLSALFGLGYAAYYVGTYYAVTWQAGAFTKEWFGKLRDGKAMEAFLDTQDPARRKHDRPNDVDYMYANYGAPAGAARKGQLPLFLEGIVARVLHDAGNGGEIRSLGVKDWKYADKGYHVEELYQVTTDEGEYNFIIAVQSSQGPEFEGRKWKVDLKSTGYVDKPRLTPLGKTLDQWRQQTRTIAQTWLGHKNRGDMLTAFRGTIPDAERLKIYHEFHGRWLASALAIGTAGGGQVTGLANAAAFVTPEAVAYCYLPGYQAFSDGGLIQADELSAPRSVREDLIRDVKTGFHHKSLVYFRSSDTGGRSSPVNKARGQYQIVYDVEVSAYPNGMEKGGEPKYRCDAYLILESDTGPMTQDRTPSWHVAGIKLIRGGAPTPEPPPAAGGPGPKIPGR